MDSGAGADDDDADAGEAVMSEVHLGCSPHLSSCLSVFTITSPALPPAKREIPMNSMKMASSFEGYDEHSFCAEASGAKGCEVCLDDQHDLIIPRRKRKRPRTSKSHDIILIHHRLKTSISFVGLQVWKGALLLSDFLLHKMHTCKDLDGVIALELGSGTGLAGIVMARKAQTVFLTDIGVDTLDNCYRNVVRNTSLDAARVRELDWKGSWPLNASTTSVEGSRSSNSVQYCWHPSDLEVAKDISVLLAADVIYSNPSTNAFFSILESLMPPESKRVLWLALEKRFNFSLDELNVVAHGYDHFLSFIDQQGEAPRELECIHSEDSRKFMGKTMELNHIAHYIIEYERTEDLELWEIQRKQVTKN